MSNLNQARHVGSLDGLRGFASLWVFFSHVQILSGLWLAPVLSWGNFAVDLFMMISGFLMAYHYIGRSDKEPWNKSQTWIVFWLRRFFRIAPAYYFLLLIAMLLGPTLGAYRGTVAEAFPSSATPGIRYLDHSLSNILAHVTFVFGAIPKYAFRTPLPDWSVGLEMQFYAVLPIVMPILGRKFSIIRGLLIFSAFAGFYTITRSYFSHFEMPTHIVMRMHVFLIGISVAYGLHEKSMKRPLVLIAIISAFMLSRRPSFDGLFFLFVTAIFIMILAGQLFGVSSRLLDPIRRLLSNKVSVFFGDTAYGLYLVHLLVLIPVSGLLAKNQDYVNLNPWIRFLLCGVISLPIALLLARCIFRWIETPGIKLGKAIVAKFVSRA